MADLLKAAKDPKFREDVIRGLGETFSRGVAGVLGAPVDLTTMAMRPFGYNVPAEQVVGGSEYIGRQMEEAGLISSARNPVAEFLAGVAIPDPMDAAKLGAMFIGPIARVWDADAAARAAKMEAEGFDPRTIWSETGTWRGPDNKWGKRFPTLILRQSSRQAKNWSICKSRHQLIRQSLERPFHMKNCTRHTLTFRQ